MSKHNYIARITQECPLFQVEPLVSIAQNLGEMVIASKGYESEIDCNNDATGLLSTFGSLLEQITDVKFVIVTKINPLYDAQVEDKSIAKTEQWAKNTMCRIYVAEAKALKKKNELKFTIWADINVTMEHLEQMHAQSGHSKQ